MQEESPSLGRWNQRPTFLFPPQLRASIGRGVGLRIVVRLQLGRAGGRFVERERARRSREGKEILAFQNDSDRRRKTDHPQQSPNDEAPRGRKKRGGSPEMGQALRAAYQQAVNEDIPPEMLDLLGKLG
ncbi:MAG TPA: NepR family anti-sigma factor [Allosphingosinicella sp.]|jgi:hypothetical protein|nr:NepR family anti-sigma factor [Allosphingosinicella sp.]